MIEITIYTDKYKDDVIKLILDTYEKEMGFVGYERPDIYNIGEIYLSDSGSNFWLAIENGKLIGTIGLLKKSNDLAYIKRMVVKKEFRKKGLGKRLLKIALNFAKDNGIKIIYAGTVKENPVAIKFYKDSGFVETDNVLEDITAADDSICLEIKLN